MADEGVEEGSHFLGVGFEGLEVGGNGGFEGSGLVGGGHGCFKGAEVVVEGEDGGVEVGLCFLACVR